jgi:F-type H+-transporting ATPase subunit delta
MGNSLTAKRYAKSLIASAIEKGSVDAVYADMNLVGGTLAENRDLQNTLTSPIIKPEKKLVILDLIFKGKVNDMTTGFMKLVSENNRVDILGEIAYAYVLEYKAYKNISLVEVTSAVQLDDAQKAKILAIAAQQGATNAEVVETIDPALLGGFVLKMGDKQIDASILNKFNNLKQELIKN